MDRCAKCGGPLGDNPVETGYRKGGSGEEVAEWTCASCWSEIYDEAMSHMGNY